MTVAELRTWLNDHQQTNGAIPEAEMQIVVSLDLDEDRYPCLRERHARIEEYEVFDLDIDPRGDLVIKSTGDQRI